MEKCNIIIIDDDQETIKNFKTNFSEQDEYVLFFCNSFSEAIPVILNKKFDAILLNYSLKNEEININKFCDIIKRSLLNSNSYIIAYLQSYELTSKNIQDLSVFNFIFEKPKENLQEIKSRLNNLIKKEPIDKIENNSFIEKDKGFYFKNVNLGFTFRENLIFSLLFNKKGTPVPVDDIYFTLYHKQPEEDFSNVRHYIQNIREKIEKVSPGKEYIRTEYKFGYTLVNSP